MRVGIIGGTGYTGVELLRLLSVHPEVELGVITSRSEMGKPVADLFPSLRGHVSISFSSPDSEALLQCDVVFAAAPHGVAQDHAPRLLNAGVKLIDLSADFRIKDPELWAKWYGQAHRCTELLPQAVYGLPEVNRESIKQSDLIAVPGCYPTAVQLGFLPLLEAGIVDSNTLIADAKSGVSGAGRKASVGTLFSETSDSLKAYGVPGHRHLPEIVQGLEQATGKNIGLTFVPHLTPMIRGIHATLYAQLTDSSVDIQDLYESRYSDEPFVDVLPPGSHPDTRGVRGSNVCRLACHCPQQGNTVVILAVEDNLVKGAAGQAVQVMNLMFNFDEKTGLCNPPLMP
ncbi:N-acetyl-gamma-glutamyl-phosphate reductase [Pseudomonadota bacterium]